MKKKIKNRIFTVGIAIIIAFTSICSYSLPVFAAQMEDAEEEEPTREEENGISAITSITPLSNAEAEISFEDKPSLEEISGMLPKELSVFLDEADSPTILSVTWECGDDYENTEFDVYEFTPVWDTDVYPFASSFDAFADMPYVTVYVQQGAASIRLVDVAEAQGSLNDLVKNKEVYALLYLCDTYDVKQQPDKKADAIVAISTGQSVRIIGVGEDSMHNIWYQVSTDIGGNTYNGYMEREYLAYSDEDLLAWEDRCISSQTYRMAAPAALGMPADIAQFPSSYQSGLLNLKTAHPNWIFVRMNTDLDWNTAVLEENKESRSLISSTVNSSWKKSSFDKSWSYPTDGILAYYMDPRNFLTENCIFQFELLSYNATYHTESAVQGILSGTFMSGAIPSDSKGQSYAQAFCTIAKQFDVSPFHLASRVRQEQGNGTSPLISGTHPSYPNVYNYFNIGATGQGSAQVIENGLKKASEYKWTTRYLSLEGGSNIVSKEYIRKAQNTLYLQKFNVSKTSPFGPYRHQYMQNIAAPSSEAVSVKKAYAAAGSINNPFVFRIPVYNNMPSAACAQPAAVKEVTLNKNTLSLKVDESAALSASIDGKAVDASSVSYSSSNSKVASVAANGTVTAVSAGTAVISCTVSGGSTASCTVTVVAELSSIHKHSYSSSVAEQASCTEKGVKTYSCSCGDSYSEEIPALGHDMADNTCRRCGYVESKDNNGSGQTNSSSSNGGNEGANNSNGSDGSNSANGGNASGSNNSANSSNTSGNSNSANGSNASGNSNSSTNNSNTSSSSNNSANGSNTSSSSNSSANGSNAPSNNNSSANGSNAPSGNTPNNNSSANGSNAPSSSNSSTNGSNAPSGSNSSTNGSNAPSGSNSSANGSNAPSNSNSSTNGSNAPSNNNISTNSSNVPSNNSSSTNNNNAPSSSNSSTNGSNAPSGSNSFTNGSNAPSSNSSTSGSNASSGSNNSPANSSVKAAASPTNDKASSVTIDMRSTTVLYEEALSAIRGRDIDVILNMGNSISWTINGSNIVADEANGIDMGIAVNGGNIPEPILSRASALSGTGTIIEISLAHDGALDFRPILTISAAPENAGLIANLYYYNPDYECLEFMVGTTIAENGDIRFTFSHASDYVVIISETVMTDTGTITSADADENEASAEASPDESLGAAPTDESSFALKPSTLLIIAAIILIIIAIACTAFFIFRSKESTVGDEDFEEEDGEEEGFFEEDLSVASSKKDFFTKNLNSKLSKNEFFIENLNSKPSKNEFFTEDLDNIPDKKADKREFSIEDLTLLLSEKEDESSPLDDGVSDDYREPKGRKPIGNRPRLERDEFDDDEFDGFE